MERQSDGETIRWRDKVNATNPVRHLLFWVMPPHLNVNRIMFNFLPLKNQQRQRDSVGLGLGKLLSTAQQDHVAEKLCEF
jgi:hypothetical protein